MLTVAGSDVGRAAAPPLESAPFTRLTVQRLALTPFFQQLLTAASTVPHLLKRSRTPVDYNALFDRIMGQVDQAAYMALADVVDPAQRDAMAEVEAHIRDPGLSSEATEARIRALHAASRIDRIHMLSALHVLAASPKVADYDLAARYVAEQEMASLSAGGPRLQANLASVDRHRGVLAFLQAHYGVALDYFSRAFERQHSAGNLANVLATLLRLGDLDEARSLLTQVRSAFDRSLVADLDHMIDQDPDLAMLRAEDSPC